MARSAQGSLTALADEGHDLLYQRVAFELGGHVVEALLQGALSREQQPVGPAEIVDCLPRKAAPLKPDDVEPGEMGAIADRHAVRDQVVLEPRQPSKEGVSANPSELNDRRPAAKDGVVPDRAVSRQH